MRQLFLFIAFFMLSFAASGQDSAYERALLLLERGGVFEAYQTLESIPVNDLDFVRAMVELQKIHYRRQNWQKFFAYAQFYRYKVVGDMGKNTSPIHERMISLEVMALAKHCQWKTAVGILDWAMRHKQRFSEKGLEELQATREHLQLNNQFPAAVMAEEDRIHVSGIFSSEQTWKIESKSLSSIAHPKYLSVKLRSVCKE